MAIRESQMIRSIILAFAIIWIAPLPAAAGDASFSPLGPVGIGLIFLWDDVKTRSIQGS